MGTRVTRSGCSLGGARFSSSELDPSGDERHQVHVSPKRGPESPDPGEVHVGKRVTRSRRGPGGEQTHQIQVKSRWVPESPDPGEAKVGTRATRSR